MKTIKSAAITTTGSKKGKSSNDLKFVDTLNKLIKQAQEMAQKEDFLKKLSTSSTNQNEISNSKKIASRFDYFINRMKDNNIIHST